MYTVYILYSAKLDKYYIGSSADIIGRLRRHNSHSKGFTSTGRPWILAYSEEFAGKQEAVARERQLKMWNRLTVRKKRGSSSPHVHYKTDGKDEKIVRLAYVLELP